MKQCINISNAIYGKVVNQMEPIISPVWIYLIHLANTLHAISICIFAASLIIWVLMYVGTIEIDDSDSERERKRLLKIFAIIMTVCVLTLIFIPDKDTMYAMLATSFITPDNIAGGEEHLIDLVTKIANIIYNTPK